ncbi:class D sortase [Eubacterium oxidoreducens]|uniref:Sortase A n=1 Tax=Eubacterium oxidoreducens TaxID=1732 RepID=A0A1G6CQN0_EUBOX|nr:class D sortase [Eubacterium oxidoreducens]SDB35206.1 sortase A [Eubacterium oxidoreducens]
MKKIKIKKLIGCLLIILGAAVIISSILFNIYQQIQRKNLIEEYRQTVTAEDSQSATNDASQDKNTNLVCIVRIPKIDSENPVVEGTSSSSLSAALGHESSTALPGETGNCVIAGHRNYTFGQYFNRLSEIEEGDMIYVDTDNTTYSYKVSSISVVEPTDLSVLEQSTDKKLLTLYTCTPIYVATHRLVITAELETE